jgi:hypothetical protein
VDVWSAVEGNGGMSVILRRDCDRSLHRVDADVVKRDVDDEEVEQDPAADRAGFALLADETGSPRGRRPITSSR